MATSNMSGTSGAFESNTVSMDIPNPRDTGFFPGRDSFAAVVARSLPVQQLNMLPTPPNSISPSLPPQALKARQGIHETPPACLNIDSDIDLQDAVDHANSQDQPQGLLSAQLNGDHDLDMVGAITPGLLAKHHLPDILLAHGPLAIRHIMGYLTTSVPGFSGIPPTKARRLVVGALEGRGSGGEGGGINGDVEFAKVGWGRWEANIKGHQQEHSPPGSFSSSPAPSNGLQIPTTGRFQRSRNNNFGSIWAADSVAFSHDELEDFTMLEHEADKMSLDGDASCSSSEAPDDGPVMDEDVGDVTDEEDWAQIGAEALRQGSISASGGHNTYLSAHISTSGPARSALAKSVPFGFHSFSPGFGVGSDSQEREAIEALVRLSSV